MLYLQVVRISLYNRMRRKFSIPSTCYSHKKNQKFLWLEFVYAKFYKQFNIPNINNTIIPAIPKPIHFNAASNESRLPVK